jgi:hypothetical protein
MSIFVKEGAIYKQEVQTKDGKFVIHDPPEDLQ